MLRVVTLLAVALLAAAHPAERILEHELTLALQEALAPYDPTIIDALANLNITTDHSSVIFNAFNVEASGFSHLEVTNFIPPIPFVSHEVTMAMTITTLAFRTDDYNLAGTHNGQPITASGTGSLTLNNFGAEVKFRSESVSLSPLSMCVEMGSLTMDLTVESIDSALDGAGEINDDINNNGPALLEVVEQQLNANTDGIVNEINNALCTAR